MIMISIWWNLEMHFIENSMIWLKFRGLFEIFSRIAKKKKKKHILGSFETHLCVFNSFMCKRPGRDFFYIWKKKHCLDLTSISQKVNTAILSMKIKKLNINFWFISINWTTFRKCLNVPHYQPFLYH